MVKQNSIFSGREKLGDRQNVQRKRKSEGRKKRGRKGRMHLCSGSIDRSKRKRKTLVGFEFEKQMKKFNDVELRCRALSRQTWFNGFSDIKLLLCKKLEIPIFSFYSVFPVEKKIEKNNKIIENFREKKVRNFWINRNNNVYVYMDTR